MNPKVRLVMLRKSTVLNEKAKKFDITLETVYSDFRKTTPEGLKVKIRISAERLSSSRSKIETSFLVNHDSSTMMESV